ncbi:MAG: T9SS type A sorting domain-containing protein [Chitinophagaceae bacterium]|nr:T9SS type A sorting domain-containing protein [Chitinophagaceae bacterium]
MNKVYSYLLIFTAFLNSNAFAQTELVFANPTRTGTDGAVGTVYKFASVTTGIDALVTISDRSSSLVTLSTIDLTTSGFANSFQPRTAYNNGDAPKNATWWMEFSISFVSSANNNTAVAVNSFNVTALDMDGDDKKLREQVTFYGLSSYTLETPTSITVSNVTNGKTFTGDYADYSNINTSATNIMVTATYTNTSTFKVRIGGSTGNMASSSTERMSSLWFKSFTYNNPNSAILPVNLIYFKAGKLKNAAILDWATSLEKEFSHFIVERSADGNSYNDIATVSGSRTNSTTEKIYSYTDTKAASMQVAYYRLKMVDIDGKFRYSEVKVIRNAVDQSAVVAFPNPAVSELHVNIPASWQNKNVTYSIYHINGTVVKQKNSTQASQTETINLAGLQAGTYIVKITSGSESVVKQFSKQG